MSDEEKISAEEMLALVNQQAVAKTTAQQAQIEELKFNNVLLTLRIKYSLAETDSIDPNGVIKRG